MMSRKSAAILLWGTSLLLTAIVTADDVNFVNARNDDGILNFQAQSHDVRYYTYQTCANADIAALQNIQQKMKIGLRKCASEESAIIFSMKAPLPGNYTLKFKNLIVDNKNEGGRHVGLYVLPAANPQIIITSAPKPAAVNGFNYQTPVKIGQNDISNGRVRFMLRGMTWAPSYLSGVKLVAKNSTDELDLCDIVQDGKLSASAIAHNFSYVRGFTPDNRPAVWNLRENGCGLGTSAALGYLSFKLRVFGPGRYLLRINGIELPANVLPGTSVLNVNGQNVNSSLLNNGSFETEFLVTPQQAKTGRLEIAIKPMLPDIVYIKSVSLKPLEKSTDFLKMATLNCCIIWPCGSYKDFDPFMLPPGHLPKPVIEIQGAKNEWVNAVLNAGNYLKGGDNSLMVKFSLSDFINQSGEKLPASIFRLLSLCQLKAGANNPEMVWQALKPQDYLCLPRQQLRQLWLAGRLPKKVDAGTYCGQLKATWNGGEKIFEIKLRIYNFSLPDDAPVAIVNWFSIYGRPDIFQEKCLKDYREHYGNTINTLIDKGLIKWACDTNGKTLNSFNTARLEEFLSAAKKYGYKNLLLQFADNLKNLDWLGGPEISLQSPDYPVNLKYLIDSIIDTSKKYGYGPNNCLLYPYDEYIGSDFVRIGRMIKQQNPDVKIFTDRAGSLDEMIPATPYLDIWCPHVLECLAKDKSGAILQYMQKTNKPVWSYTCTDSRTGLAPIRHYRWHSWFTFEKKLDGIAAWKYMGDNCGLVAYPAEIGLPDDTGPIWSPRYLAWTDGIEDYMYLKMLDEFCRKNPDNNQTHAIKKLINDAISEVLANPADSAVYEKWHKLMGEKIDELNAKGIFIK